MIPLNTQHLTGILGLANQVEPKTKALPYLELDSMMLSQVVEIAQKVSQNDINRLHIQNWVRRKYLSKPYKKKYNREQVANILLINDLRNILPLEQISALLRFVNQDLPDQAGDRIHPAKLYRYYSDIFDRTRQDWEKMIGQLAAEVEDSLAPEDMREEDRSTAGVTLMILNLLARANVYKQIAGNWLEKMAGERNSPENSKEEG
ncbi:MAG: DUF1836 domain-containing protein [Peptococcaceae bacterium]|jgi:DNA-binding transcriptional MerR regulator|nr:DUF1836 domain-containing protein [Peptococcaceae bacterium]